MSVEKAKEWIKWAQERIRNPSYVDDPIKLLNEALIELEEEESRQRVFKKRLFIASEVLSQVNSEWSGAVNALIKEAIAVLDGRENGR